MRVAFVIVFVYLIVSFVLQSVDVLRLAGQASALEEELETLRRSNQVLQERIEYAKTDEYIEQVARERLGLVGPNEIPYARGGDSTGP